MGFARLITSEYDQGRGCGIVFGVGHFGCCGHGSPPEMTKGARGPRFDGMDAGGGDRRQGARAGMCAMVDLL